jgi:hypothetical protein
MALYHNQLLDVHFNQSFYKHILGLKVGFEDLESLDKSFHKSLQQLLQLSVEDIGFETQTFTTTIDYFGKYETVN